MSRTNSVRFPLAALALIACATLTACSRPKIPWNAETTFRFDVLTPADASVVERVFARHNAPARRVGDEPLAYVVSENEIRTARELAYLHRDLRAAVAERQVEMPLRAATLVYGGVDARGSVLTTVSINVSPGARAFIADRLDPDRPWREVSVDASGRWDGPVNTRGAVRRTGGWVYIAANRDGVFRYSRVNVLSSAQERVPLAALSKVNLPAPSPATIEQTERRDPREPDSRQDNETENDESGFKWPWQ